MLTCRHRHRPHAMAILIPIPLLRSGVKSSASTPRYLHCCCLSSLSRKPHRNGGLSEPGLLNFKILFKVCCNTCNPSFPIQHLALSLLRLDSGPHILYRYGWFRPCRKGPECAPNATPGGGLASRYTHDRAKTTRRCQAPHFGDVFGD